MFRLVSIGAAALLAAGTPGCDSSRDRPAGEGVHPAGWAVEGDPAFHGPEMVAQGYPFDECRSCHGDDFAGGDVGVSCGGAGCHVDGVDDCAGTCHGDDQGPLPDTGRHQSHIARVDGCETCHPVPGGFGDGFEGGTHINGAIDVTLPSWQPAERDCADACHFGQSPGWDSTEALGCDGCHQQSPTHDRFDRLVSEDTCGNCHGGSPDVGHINFQLTIAIDRCDTCHGSGPFGAPPVALDGSSDPTDPGVGAHRRHLDSLLPGRIGKVVPCTRCHQVPGDLFADGHLDSSAPADVRLILGDYDPVTRSCVVSCHFDRDPGPVWTDNSGAELACDACHEFPPTTTRIGTSHPPVDPPVLSECTGCHPFNTTTHVNGEVNFL